MFAREGAGAVHIRVTEPAGTDSIPDGEITDRGPDPNNPPFDLVATNKGMHGHASVVVSHVLIAVADPAVRHRDFHLVRGDGTRLVFKRCERRTSFHRGVGANGG